DDNCRVLIDNQRCQLQFLCCFQGKFKCRPFRFMVIHFTEQDSFLKIEGRVFNNHPAAGKFRFKTRCCIDIYFRHLHHPKFKVDKYFSARRRSWSFKTLLTCAVSKLSALLSISPSSLIGTSVIISARRCDMRRDSISPVIFSCIFGVSIWRLSRSASTEPWV